MSKPKIPQAPNPATRIAEEIAKSLGLTDVSKKLPAGPKKIPKGK